MVCRVLCRSRSSCSNFADYRTQPVVAVQSNTVGWSQAATNDGESGSSKFLLKICEAPAQLVIAVQSTSVESRRAAKNDGESGSSYSHRITGFQSYRRIISRPALYDWCSGGRGNCCVTIPEVYVVASGVYSAIRATLVRRPVLCRLL